MVICNLVKLLPSWRTQLRPTRRPLSEAQNPRSPRQTNRKGTTRTHGKRASTVLHGDRLDGHYWRQHEPINTEQRDQQHGANTRSRMAGTNGDQDGNNQKKGPTRKAPCDTTQRAGPSTLSTRTPTTDTDRSAMLQSSQVSIPYAVTLPIPCLRKRLRNKTDQRHQQRKKDNKSKTARITDDPRNDRQREDKSTKKPRQGATEGSGSSAGPQKTSRPKTPNLATQRKTKHCGSTTSSKYTQNTNKPQHRPDANKQKDPQANASNTPPTVAPDLRIPTTENE